jgi:hypothetical protein
LPFLWYTIGESLKPEETPGGIAWLERETCSKRP